eukprot:COSAG02_NODE_871_length_16337_cov_7.124276_6_plen_151_part_00
MGLCLTGCSVCVASKISRQKAKGQMQHVQRPIHPSLSINLDFMVGLPEIDVRGIKFSKFMVAVENQDGYFLKIRPLLYRTACALRVSGLLVHDHVALARPPSAPAAGKVLFPGLFGRRQNPALFGSAATASFCTRLRGIGIGEGCGQNQF